MADSSPTAHAVHIGRVAMRLGVIFEPNSNAHYRAVSPMRAMERRGHVIVWPDRADAADPRAFVGCDVLHVYRCHAGNTHPVLSGLARQGVRLTFDNDDDIANTPKETLGYDKVGGAIGQRTFAATVRVARLARIVTTPNETLAQRYRDAGIGRVDVIGNYLAPDIARPRRRHDGIVIGWIAAAEHQADAAHIGIADALSRVMAKHSSVRVECIGIDLALDGRYRHDVRVAFDDLPARIGGFDIGIAPLADIPFNRARSDIKLKEYAASGVPWLASPVGPYVGLGEEQGGTLVRDDQWFAALDLMVSRRLRRWSLARKAGAWARQQTIDAAADTWERVFTEAAR